MAVSIQLLSGSDNVGLSRPIINANFSALKAAADASAALLNPSTSVLSGIKSVQVDNTALSLSSTILSISKSATVLGNMTLGTISASTNLTINGTGGVSISEGSLQLTTGNVTLAGISSLLTINGGINIVGEKRAPGLATAFLNTIGLTSTTTVNIVPSGLKYVIITNGATSSDAVFGLTASLSAGTVGQEVEIYHVAGPSGPTRIDASNFYGLSGSIVMTKTGDKIKCIYEGSSWYLWDFTPGATASITFNRV